MSVFQLLPMCLKGCGKELQERVTLYLQQTYHSTQQPLLSLLEYQDAKMKQDCISREQKDTVSIAEQMKSEIQEDSSNQEFNSATKRRRETMSPDEEVSDVNMLLNSLSKSYFLVKKIKESDVSVDDKDSKKVKTTIERMLLDWDMVSQK